MPARFNAPPNWPVPAGWTPPPHWKPDPAWGPPPYGWQVWVEESPSRSVCRRHVLVAFGVVVGLGSMVGYVQAFSAPETEPASTYTTNTEDAGRPAAERPAPSSREGARPARPAAPAEVDVSRQDPVPYSVSPPDVDTPPPSRAPRTPATPGKRPGGSGAAPGSPRATPPPDADRGREPAPGEGPSDTPRPRIRPGHDANERPQRLGDDGGSRDWWGEHSGDPRRGEPSDRSGDSRPRPRFEQPVKALRPTRSETPPTPAPVSTTSAPAPRSAPVSAGGVRGPGRAS